MTKSSHPSPHEASLHAFAELVEASLHAFAELVRMLPAAVALLDRDFRYLAHSESWPPAYLLAEQDLVGRRHPRLRDPQRGRQRSAAARAGAARPRGLRPDPLRTLPDRPRSLPPRWSLDPVEPRLSRHHRRLARGGGRRAHLPGAHTPPLRRRRESPAREPAGDRSYGPYEKEFVRKDGSLVPVHLGGEPGASGVVSKPFAFDEVLAPIRSALGDDES